MEELTLLRREKGTSHSARKERREGNVPGVIYGKEIGNALIDVKALDLEKQISVAGEHCVINFDFQGKKGTAVIKELQKSPVAHKIIHIDLEEVADDYKMHTEVPVKITGKGLLEGKGLILQTQRDLVKIVCTAKDLPKDIELDVSEGKVGTVYTVKDLKVSANVEFDEDLADVIGSVSFEERDVEDDDDDSESTTTTTTEA